MKSARPIVGAIFCLAVVVGSACGASTSSSTSTPHSSPNASSSAAASSSPGVSLDPQVAMPSGFPSDVPIYTGARLTSAGNFASNGATTWGMEWETAGGIDKVRAFYTAKLNQGDWTSSFSGSANGAFAVIFNRKSNSKVGGILGVDGSTGFTKISLALTSAA